MLIQRRAFLAGLGSLLAAPAIVRAQNIMPVRSIERLTLPAFGYDSFDQPYPDVSYQWVDAAFRDVMTANGWRPVPVDRYGKMFSISGPEIQIHGSALMEKATHAVVDARAAEVQAARDLVGDWKRRYAEFNPQVRQTDETDRFTAWRFAEDINKEKNQ